MVLIYFGYLHICLFFHVKASRLRYSDPSTVSQPQISGFLRESIMFILIFTLLYLGWVLAIL